METLTKETAKMKSPHIRAWHLGETWIEPEDTSNRRAMVRLPDGSLRVVRCGVSDTMFSVPAKFKGESDPFIMQENDELCLFFGSSS